MGQVSMLGNRIAVFSKGVVEPFGPSMGLHNHAVNAFVAAFIGAPRHRLIPRPPHAATAAPRGALWDAFACQTVALAPDARRAMVFAADERLIN